MKTVLVLGGLGMLGSAVGQWFQSQDGFDVWLTGRDLGLAYGRKDHWIKFDPTGRVLDACTALADVFHLMPKNPDFVINCVGVIKPYSLKSVRDTILINSFLPHEWAAYCKAVGSKFIQITTDCVFDGKKGGYVEDDLHNATDVYGKSKSLGEPGDAMVLRTSIIGPELKENVSLIAWAQSQKGKQVKGFRDHFWNGCTTKQYGKICQQIIEKDLYQEGLFHVFSNKVSKRELLELIGKRFDLDLKIESVSAPEPCDRSLSTAKPAALMMKLEIPFLDQQLAEI